MVPIFLGHPVASTDSKQTYSFGVTGAWFVSTATWKSLLVCRCVCPPWNLKCIILISGSHMASSSDDDRWNKLILKGKELTKKRKLEEALAAFRKALALRHSDKLVSRIKKIEVLLSACVLIYGYHLSGKSGTRNCQGIKNLSGKCRWTYTVCKLAQVKSHKGVVIVWLLR